MEAARRCPGAWAAQKNRLALGLLALAAGLQAVLLGPATGAPAPAASVSDELFTNPAIRHLRLEIPPEGLARLRTYDWRRDQRSTNRPTARATLREGERLFTNVAVHLKGAAGSFRPVDARPALTLNFDKFAPGQRFHGLDKISLNNSVQDPGYVCEKLSRELFLRAGVPVPRADYATVELNGRHLGLYVLVEGWDKRFLKRHFPDNRGNLYDPPQGWDIHRTLPVSSGERPEDQSELKALAAAAAEPDPDQRLARLEATLDLDRFLTLLVLDTLLWNWDGYAMNLNNYRVFHDRAAGRVVLMPHGLDQLFWNPEGPLMLSGPGLLSGAVLHTAEGRRRYLERFVQLRAELFNPDALTRRVQQLAERLRPTLRAEGLFTFVAHQHALNGLQERIVARVRSLDEQFDAARKNTLRLEPGEAVGLTGWRPRAGAGATLDQAGPPPALHLRLDRPGSAAWATTVWLEHGRYRIEGRVKTQAVNALAAERLAGAGLRVLGRRKQNEGLDWRWTPFARGRNRERRGEILAPGFIPKASTGTADWTPLVYRLELRQPLADLDVLCELRAATGEAWFELDSLRLRREP